MKAENEIHRKKIISIYTDPDDVVIDPCAGSGSTLRAAFELGRNSYGFEIDRNMYKEATSKMLFGIKPDKLSDEYIQEELVL